MKCRSSFALVLVTHLFYKGEQHPMQCYCLWSCEAQSPLAQTIRMMPCLTCIRAKRISNAAAHPALVIPIRPSVSYHLCSSMLGLILGRIWQSCGWSHQAPRFRNISSRLFSQNPGTRSCDQRLLWPHLREPCISMRALHEKHLWASAIGPSPLSALGLTKGVWCRS